MAGDGASVPDQALVASPSSPQAVSTEGFDPSRNYALEYRVRKQRADQVAEIIREIEERERGN